MPVPACSLEVIGGDCDRAKPRLCTASRAREEQSFKSGPCALLEPRKQLLPQALSLYSYRWPWYVVATSM